LHTDLSSADLKGAYMSDARLIFVDLNDARLSSATLSNADLTRAEGVNNEELEQQAESLEGARMPNGQQYEEWRKSKGSGEDGENSGAS
jgi:uncharacterized protein YjbI with pentapeptide repeats